MVMGVAMMMDDGKYDGVVRMTDVEQLVMSDGELLMMAGDMGSDDTR